MSAAVDYGWWAFLIDELLSELCDRIADIHLSLALEIR